MPMAEAIGVHVERNTYQRAVKTSARRIPPCREGGGVFWFEQVVVGDGGGAWILRCLRVRSVGSCLIRGFGKVSDSRLECWRVRCLREPEGRMGGRARCRRRWGADVSGARGMPRR